MGRRLRSLWPTIHHSGDFQFDVPTYQYCWIFLPASQALFRPSQSVLPLQCSPVHRQPENTQDYDWTHFDTGHPTASVYASLYLLHRTLMDLFHFHLSTILFFLSRWKIFLHAMKMKRILKAVRARVSKRRCHVCF